MQKNRISQQSPIEQYVIAFLLVSSVIFLTFTSWTQKLDNIFYDFYIQNYPLPVPDDIAIIAIDERSLSTLGQWPWRRSVHAELLRQLQPEEAKAIVFDVIFAEPDQLNPAADEAMAAAMQQAGNVFIPIHIRPLSNRNSLEEIAPLKKFSAAAAGVGHVHFELDDDGIARGLYLREGMGKAYWPALSLATLDWSRGKTRSPLRAFVSTTVSPYVNVREDYLMIPFAGGAGSIKAYSYIDVVSGNLPAGTFSNKTVFIGSTAAGLGDFVSTPVSGLSAPMSGVEFHANVFNTLKNRAEISPIPKAWQYLLSVAFVLIVVLVIPRIKPERTLPTLLLVISITLLFSLLTLITFKQWYEPSTAIVGMLIAYPLWTWRRLSQLNRFLFLELAKLAQEPRLKHQAIARQNPSETVDALVFLLQPDAWVLLRDGEVFKADHYEQQQPASTLEDGYWLHEKQASWITYGHQQQHWTIGLFWASPHYKDLKRAYLHRVILPSKVAGLMPLPIAPSERIALRIEQVQDAIMNMREMRRFVSEGFDKMPDGVLVTDPVGGIIFANTHAETLLERPKHSLEGQPLQHILSEVAGKERGHWQQVFSNVLLHGKSHSTELRLQHIDVLLQFGPFMPANPGEAGLILNISNITPFKEEQRKKNETIDFLSHDMRSPLVSQLALLDNLQRTEAPCTNEVIEQIRAHARRSMSLAEQFLQVARAEQVVADSFYECDVIGIICNAQDAMIHRAMQKHISIHFDTDIDEAWLIGNPELLERVFINLLTNAIKYSPDNTAITIDVEESANDWLVSVCDQGYGIDEQELPYIFDKFHRQKKTEMSGDKGAGLGLRYVRVVIDKHLGDIHIESTVGKGTCFKIRLPKMPDNSYFSATISQH
ncbi:MAG: CHASE2 domain-containing protein [Hahellaceae bacterium]|jgi:CHASE2 domain-containing sensor protein/signal transduction histidine kinase|nr:CHASE2 domain-containing protein [Hahellaceae bacterium]MCP5211653.1 CHASE2 domain-containing protein [Hahellaceae bacterium]